MSLKVVFDLNVLASALLFQASYPAQALRQALVRGDIYISPPMLHELRDVLSRPKFNRYVSPSARQLFLTDLEATLLLTTGKEAIRVCRDPDDDCVLEAAVAAQASHIVTGDRDLLVLDPFRTIRIVTPREFLKLIESAP